MAPTTGTMGFLARIATGRPILWASFALGLSVYLLLPAHRPGLPRPIVAWDAGSLALLSAYAAWFSMRDDVAMEADAERQKTGEWLIFGLTLAGAVASLFAVASEFSAGRGLPPAQRGARVALVAATLLLSWLVTHTLFALRYAHEFYDRREAGGDVDGGLEFPSTPKPDYWDFLYFSVVLGMTFQVSDVQISDRKMRRLATAHGLLSFLFNTVIVALTVNMAANLV